MNKETLDRSEFIRKLGLGSKALLAFYCLGGISACSTESPEPEDDNSGSTGNTNTGGSSGVTGTTSGISVNFTVDLTHATYQKLKTEGEYVYVDGIIIANAKGTLVALSKACTHEGTSVQYRKNQDDLFCPNHNSRFSTSGSVLASPASKALTVYKTTLSADGNTLTVKS